MPTRPLLLRDQIRQRDRLAKLLGAAGQCCRHKRGPFLLHDTHRCDVPTLRRPSRARFRRWAEADRTALLHEWPGADVQAGSFRLKVRIAGDDGPLVSNPAVWPAQTGAYGAPSLVAKPILPNVRPDSSRSSAA